jgi:hypothetical protein
MTSGVWGGWAGEEEATDFMTVQTLILRNFQLTAADVQDAAIIFIFLSGILCIIKSGTMTNLVILVMIGCILVTANYLLGRAVDNLTF